MSSSIKKLNIKDTSMPQEMHQTVLDQLKKIVEGAGRSAVQITIDLKATFQAKWTGEWQVIVGEKQLVAYFSKKYIKEYIIITSENRTFLVFRRTNNNMPFIQEINNN